MNRRGGNWKIFCTWVPHVNNFSPVCMLAKAVYHDKWIKESLRPRAVRQLSKWLSADCSISVDIYQRLSVTPRVRASVVAGTRLRLPVWMCWVANDAGATPSPSFSFSLFQSQKLGMAFSHSPEELTISSLHFNHFQSLMKNAGQREFKTFLSGLFSFLLCVHARVLEITRNWNVKN